MYKQIISAGILLFCINGTLALASGYNEDGGEFVKIEVVFHNDTSGLIWAYRCLSCTPERLLFDGRTVVELGNDQYDVSILKDYNGSSATITWIPNTAQVLRVLLM
ncbi:hypothetical protein [Endozoicomonas sp. SESOKO1]|uniref:hypothetical protein n=1 Tax=Endozoicomonas sp. SESOKO1 TaxID=2828742 RepID=UPI0021497A75|nr:hypothetical protein [Endozoicomonas sp. SESOKO1]